jgi:hypothetical protein
MELLAAMAEMKMTVVMAMAGAMRANKHKQR